MYLPIMSREAEPIHFEESYYGHNCTIQERKSDVLKTDIRTGYLKNLRRWWYGLFLVSYTDERSKTYYMSSEAMRLDRVRQFRYFKGRIHPLSKFRNFWDGLMLALFILDQFLVNHNFSYIHDKVCLCFYWIGAAIELFIIADVIVNLNTGYLDYDTRRVIIEKSEVVMHYCSTKLFLHAASAIPIQWLLILRHGTHVACDLCKTNTFVFTLRTLAVFRLFRIYECSSYWTRERSSFVMTSLYRLLRVFVLGFATLLLIQDVGDFLSLLVMIQHNTILYNSYISLLLQGTFVRSPPSFSLKSLFIVSLLRPVRVSAGGFRFLSDDYHIDRLVAIILIAVLSFFYVWTLSEMYSLITGLTFVDNDLQKFKTNARGLVYSHQLNSEMAKKIDTFYDFKFAHMDLIEQRNILVSTMPQVLKRESALACYRRYVKRVPYLSEWPAEVVDELVLMLRRETYLSDDMVAEPGQPSEGLAIVAAGELAVYSGQEERGRLIDGDFFGELSLVTDHEIQMSTVFAVTNCVILMLDKIPFRLYMRNHVDLFEQLKDTLKNKYQRKPSNVE